MGAGTSSLRKDGAHSRDRDRKLDLPSWDVLFANIRKATRNFSGCCGEMERRTLTAEVKWQPLVRHAAADRPSEFSLATLD
jgi:hypothetical protein